MNEIAKAAGVSKNTVSLALRNDPQLPEHTRQRIQKLADEMGYQLNPVIGQLMAQLRASNSPDTPQATLALINGNTDPEAFKKHPTIPAYVEGCKRRAHKRGYGLDYFWLHDPELNGERLNRILKARGIRGILIVGMMNSNRLPSQFNATWEQYPAVVTGVRTRQPALSFASTDHHIVAMRALERAIALGYQRPALVLDHVIDELVEGRFSSGYTIAQRNLPRKNHLPTYSEIVRPQGDLTGFSKWLEAEKPDVILTLYNRVRSDLEKLGYECPEDIGLIQLEWRKDQPEWAGMNQHNDIVGEAAVDMVISMIHNNERGVPDFPRATLISGTWVDGQTVRPRKASD